jgi:thiamine-monophosphate kinase
MLELATCDMMVEGSHFSWDIFSPQDVGIKLIYTSASDIAAMAGIPGYALLSWALPQNIKRETVAGLAEGIEKACQELEIRLAGGDTIATKERMVLACFIHGRVEKSLLCRRSGAKPGDIIALTGKMGASWSGLAYLRGKLSGLEMTDDLDCAVQRYLRPFPRLAPARLLAESGQVTSMADTSDSLSTQLFHLCRASGVGVNMVAESIPLAQTAVTAADALGLEWFRVALGAGEDYELLLTLKPNTKLESIHLPDGLPLTAVGKVVSQEQGLTVNISGKPTPLEEFGYMHFGEGSKDNDIYRRI